MLEVLAPGGVTLQPPGPSGRRALQSSCAPSGIRVSWGRFPLRWVLLGLPLCGNAAHAGASHLDASQPDPMQTGFARAGAKEPIKYLCK